MNSDPTAARTKLRQLHHETLSATEESRAALDRALVAAWQTGRLLEAERARVRRAMGRTMWQHWLTENFPGSHRIAARYLELARSVKDPDALKQLSLRQAYFRLGVSTEPKVRGKEFRLPRLPPHIRNAQRVLLSVRTRLRLRQLTAEERKHFCDDLRPLHEQLCVLFSSDDRGASRAAFRKSA